MNHTDRRDFLRLTTAAGIALTAPRFLRARNTGDRLNVAAIGVGGRGAGNLGAVSKENVVAICDVNANSLGPAARKNPRAEKFTDFRRLFDRPKEFDAVVVSTCEHTHAFATLPALQLGK